MSEFLTAKYRRRYFVTGGLITLIAIGLLRFVLIPHVAGLPIPSVSVVTDSILDKLFVALLASLIAAFFVMWLVPPADHIAVIDVIEPAKIREVLEEGYEQTLEWCYKGAVGRHFRAVTMPALARSAKKRNVIVKINALILDPRRINHLFSLNRSRLLSAEKRKPWTEELLRREIYASIVAIYAYKAQESSLEISLGLTDRVEVFRIDLATNLVVVTTEGDKDFGLRCDAGTLFYKSFREDVLLASQAAETLPTRVRGIPNEQLTVENVKGLLSDLGIWDPTLTEADLLEILSYVRNSKNPYG